MEKTKFFVQVNSSNRFQISLIFNYFIIKIIISPLNDSYEMLIFKISDGQKFLPEILKKIFLFTCSRVINDLNLKAFLSSVVMKLRILDKIHRSGRIIEQLLFEIKLNSYIYLWLLITCTSKTITFCFEINYK
ncbi:hypothetical protein BpHYR1_019457 [Brachionus plicatilis]|uniref:Uncharacterized protein n=1 Tax=Brachionus plicatilis TaxID=10195 RepID=A0A3M7SF52_BRAPC|nr:hypothetical protein BpHYR1_019457 [Brachionus plicatilis]